MSDEDEIWKLEAEVNRLRDMLKEVEWSGYNSVSCAQHDLADVRIDEALPHYHFCPFCGAYQCMGHLGTCELGGSLDGAKETCEVGD